MYLWICKIIKRIITVLTSMQLNILKKYSIDDRFEEARGYLQSWHPYFKIEIEANNKISVKYDLQIIMPAYNVEKYIKRSIDSVICQKTKYSYLLTIVNDGSTDKTREIIESYKNHHSIEILNQDNKGVACARNYALENMKGKYIMFLDSDDYLYENAIEKLLERAFLLDADIVEGSSYSVYNGKFLRRTGMHQDSGNKTENNLWGYPWGKVIKAEVFESIKFPEKYYYQDTIFSYCIYPYYLKKYTISDFVYVYRKNYQGISITSKKKAKAIDTYWLMGYMWRRYGSEMVNMDGAQEKALRHMVLCFSRTKKLERGKVTKAGFVYLSEIYLKIFENNNQLDGKYKQIDQCIREKLYKSYKLLCQRWRFLK